MQCLISASELKTLQNAIILDARFRLQDPTAAARLFLEGHIPQAQRVDLDRDLSGKKTGTNGRHPLPDKAHLRELFSRLGIGSEMIVIAYDDTDHAGAARAWMLLRWLGHEKVRVLDGGLKSWIAAGYNLETMAAPERKSKDFKIRPSLVSVLSIDQLANTELVDVRSSERYRGENEPIDPRAGHIPGARNFPYSSFLGLAGKFLSENDLRKKMPSDLSSPTFYCGSGVSACVALLAAEIVGIHGNLYAGSWSEWCSRPESPIETEVHSK